MRGTVGAYTPPPSSPDYTKKNCEKGDKLNVLYPDLGRTPPPIGMPDYAIHCQCAVDKDESMLEMSSDSQNAER